MHVHLRGVQLGEHGEVPGREEVVEVARGDGLRVDAVLEQRDRSRPTLRDAYEVGLMEHALEAHDRMAEAAANENRKP